jgi:hypothetical protein
MDSSMGFVALASLGISILSMGLFWLIWLRKGHYEMPSVVKETDLKKKSKEGQAEPAAEADQMERNLFKFTLKMSKYLYFADREVLLKDLGLEQMLYIVFMRRMIIFFLIVGIGMSIIIFVWARLTTSEAKLIILRLIGSRDITLTSLYFSTFLGCCLTVCITLFVLSLRKYMTVRILSSVVASEEKIKVHRADIFFQLRTLKFKGVDPQDRRAKVFKAIVESYMKLNNIEGRLVKLILLPYLEKRIKTENEIEDIKARFEDDALDNMSACHQKAYKCYTKKIRYDKDEQIKRLSELKDTQMKLGQEQISSGHCFCLFDTPMTASKVLEVFK